MRKRNLQQYYFYIDQRVMIMCIIQKISGGDKSRSPKLRSSHDDSNFHRVGQLFITLITF